MCIVLIYLYVPSRNLLLNIIIWCSGACRDKTATTVVSNNIIKYALESYSHLKRTPRLVSYALRHRRQRGVF